MNFQLLPWRGAWLQDGRAVSLSLHVPVSPNTLIWHKAK